MGPLTTCSFVAPEQTHAAVLTYCLTDYADRQRAKQTERQKDTVKLDNL